MYIEKFKEVDMVVSSAPDIRVSGINSGRRCVPVQNGTGVIAAPEGVEITFVGPAKRETSVIEFRELSSDTGSKVQPMD